MTCTICGMTMTPRLGYPADLWEAVKVGTRLPPTWDVSCSNCGFDRESDPITTHFLEWPDPATSPSRIKKTQ